MRLATADKVRTIDFAVSGIHGTGSLSPRARRTLAVYVALAKMAYDGISAPMGVIADAVWRSSHGEARSIRTLQRANDELKARGYINCPTYRPGERSKGAVIHFEIAAFSYWTKKTIRNVQPLPTQTHNVVSRETMCDSVTHTTTCHPADRTKDTSRVNLRNIPQVDKGQRAGARANNKQDRERERKNAVFFSLLKVLETAGHLHRTDRRAARVRAEIEVKAEGAGVVLVNPSGIDWQYWARHWQEMPWTVREATVRREILPRLLGRYEHLLTEGMSVEPIDEPSELLAVPPTAEQIRAARLALEKSVSLPTEAAAAAKVVSSPTYPEIDSSDPDMRLLLAARERCRARARVDCG